MARIWTNDAGLALNAPDLNAMETDIANSIRLWAPGTPYGAGMAAVEPGGTLQIRNTGGTSLATWAADSVNWTAYQTGVSAALAIVFGG